LSRDKGTTGQAQNLAEGRAGPGQPKFGTGRAGIAKNQDGTKRDRAEKDVLKQENDVLKQKTITGKDVPKQENDVLKQEIW
jgi:hypothetical protein